MEWSWVDLRNGAPSSPAARQELHFIQWSSVNGAAQWMKWELGNGPKARGNNQSKIEWMEGSASLLQSNEKKKSFLFFELKNENGWYYNSKYIDAEEREKSKILVFLIDEAEI